MKKSRLITPLFTLSSMLFGTPHISHAGEMSPAETDAASAFPLGGFGEEPAAAQGMSILQQRALYASYDLVSDKKQLDKALAQCAQAPETCSSGLQRFQNLVDLLKRTSDRLVQALYANAWVNKEIRDDPREIPIGNKPQRTALQAIIDRAGVCQEKGKIKFLAMNYAGIPQEDMRLVGQSITDTDRGLNNAPHMVVAIRIGNVSWILNTNQTPQSGQENHDEILKSVLIDSYMEDAETNFYNQNRRFLRRSFIMPETAANLTQASVLNLPENLDDLTNKATASAPNSAQLTLHKAEALLSVLLFNGDAAALNNSQPMKPTPAFPPGAPSKPTS